MKYKVITIKDHPESEACADRCIESAKRYDINVTKYYGFSAKDNPLEVARELEVPLGQFQEKYSRLENCVAAFLSHMQLWEKSVEWYDEVLILEHDAVFMDPLPRVVHYSGVLSFGQPSYGKWVMPTTIGINPLMSKQYMPGAHAYLVKPSAAKKLLQSVHLHACPTDLYLSNKHFNFIEEYYPWPIKADDSFTTIQNETGCLAKHNYNKEYAII
jgi:hypothetical protein